MVRPAPIVFVLATLTLGTTGPASASGRDDLLAAIKQKPQCDAVTVRRLLKDVESIDKEIATEGIANGCVAAVDDQGKLFAWWKHDDHREAVDVASRYCDHFYKGIMPAAKAALDHNGTFFDDPQVASSVERQLYAAASVGFIDCDNEVHDRAVCKKRNASATCNGVEFHTIAEKVQHRKLAEAALPEALTKLCPLFGELKAVGWLALSPKGSAELAQPCSTFSDQACKVAWAQKYAPMVSKLRAMEREYWSKTHTEFRSYAKCPG